MSDIEFNLSPAWGKTLTEGKDIQRDLLVKLQRLVVDQPGIWEDLKAFLTVERDIATRKLVSSKTWDEARELQGAIAVLEHLLKLKERVKQAAERQ